MFTVQIRLHFVIIKVVNEIDSLKQYFDQCSLLYRFLKYKTVRVGFYQDYGNNDEVDIYKPAKSFLNTIPASS